MIAEVRRDAELVHTADVVVAAHELFHLSPDDRQQAGLLGHAATEYHALRRNREDGIHDPDREVACLERPGGLIIELFGRLAVASAQRFAGGHALEAVTMERTGAGERIVAVMRDQDMAELGVRKSVDGLAIEHDAGADARATVM